MAGQEMVKLADIEQIRIQSAEQRAGRASNKAKSLPLVRQVDNLQLVNQAMGCIYLKWPLIRLASPGRNRTAASCG